MPAFNDFPEHENILGRWRWALAFIKGVACYLAKSFGGLSAVQRRTLVLEFEEVLEETAADLESGAAV